MFQFVIILLTFYCLADEIPNPNTTPTAAASQGQQVQTELVKEIDDNVSQATSLLLQQLDNSEDTPVTLEDMQTPDPQEVGVPWTPPNYKDQFGALGYSDTAFQTPEGLQTQVNFWKKIYSQYTTDQGVLHDAEYIDFIYQEIDFSDITKNLTMNLRQKQKAREKRVKDAKKEIIARLLKLDKLMTEDGQSKNVNKDQNKDPNTNLPKDLNKDLTKDLSKDLSGEDLRIWNLYKDVPKPTTSKKSRFFEAAQKNKLRFQLGQKDRFQLGVFYSGRYFKDMEDIFAKEGLPKELTRLVFVESSFNVFARSKVGASGLWQIMPSSGRRYFKVTSTVDMRNFPLEATRVAAKLLKSNYKLLGSWPLAITGYNHGPTGISKLVKKYRTTDLVELIQNVTTRKKFGFASRNFYASFLAALQTEGEANRVFSSQITVAPRLPQTLIKLKQPVYWSKLLTWFQGDAKLAELYNPHLSHQIRRNQVPIPHGTLVSVLSTSVLPEPDQSLIKELTTGKPQANNL